MIVVRVELHSAITHKVTELARMHISNIACNESGSKGDYAVQTFNGRDSAALGRRTVSHEGKVERHPRLQQHVWNLVRKALVATGYTQ